MGPAIILKMVGTRNLSVALPLLAECSVPLVFLVFISVEIPNPIILRTHLPCLTLAKVCIIELGAFA